MIYITQLIFLKEGKEAIFQQFEDFAIPLIEKYNGRVLYRLRPGPENYIDAKEEAQPYEIHFISFDSENDLSGFMNDKGRLAFIHLKEESVQSMLLVKGSKM